MTRRRRATPLREATAEFIGAPIELAGTPKSRSGWRTSEFAGAVVTSIAAYSMCLLGEIDGITAIGVISGSFGMYSISRGIAKR